MEISELDDLINLLSKKTQIESLSKTTLDDYRCVWRKLIKWLEDNNITHFGKTEILRYLEHVNGKAEYTYAELSSNQGMHTRSCRALINFINTGEMRRKRFVNKVNFDDLSLSEDAKYYREFIQLLPSMIKKSSVTGYKYALSILFKYCTDRKLILSELNGFHLSRLFDGSNLQHGTIYSTKSQIKTFLKWLFSNDYTSQDLSRLIPKEKVVQDKRLPTTFKDSEVRKILNCIDRGTPLGRRDFAILLCIAAYGWRISDVAQLRLENFIWREQTVSFNQVKTGVPVHIKLEPLVFNAIVDYIQHGRPNGEEYDKLNAGELFLLLSKGNVGRPMNPLTFNDILHKYMRRAGIINLSHRKHGCHALRFSLATRMIENKADIREVKDILGHQDKSVTFNYVRLDIAGLKRCNLPMPPCQSPFYSDLKEGN